MLRLYFFRFQPSGSISAQCFSDMCGAIIQMCQWSTPLVTDRVLGTGREVISSRCSVSWIIEALGYMKFLWGQPWRGGTWRLVGGMSGSVVRKDRLITWRVSAATLHMNRPSIELSRRRALRRSCFFDNTQRWSWQTSQPACHLFPGAMRIHQVGVVGRS